ncbi:hypothetical protein Aperf_G00000027525 [Anoplocephala perfoliata]
MLVARVPGPPLPPPPRFSDQRPTFPSIGQMDVPTSSCLRLSRFFRQLAQKCYVLYNEMPDIISSLSVPKVGVDEVKFRLIVETERKWPHLLSYLIFQRADEVLANTKKNAKADNLPKIEHFVVKIEEFHQKGLSDEKASRCAEMMAKKAAASV